MTFCVFFGRAPARIALLGQGGEKHHVVLQRLGHRDRPPIERRYNDGRTIKPYGFENNRPYAHPQSKSEHLGVELYLLPRAHFLIVRTQIKNNILYGRIVYTFYWWSAFMQLSEEKP